MHSQQLILLVNKDRNERKPQERKKEKKIDNGFTYCFVLSIKSLPCITLHSLQSRIHLCCCCNERSSFVAFFPSPLSFVCISVVGNGNSLICADQKFIPTKKKKKRKKKRRFSNKVGSPLRLMESPHTQNTTAMSGAFVEFNTGSSSSSIDVESSTLLGFTLEHISDVISLAGAKASH